jgi:catechol 2,3-dioxygenase-like lactoylglutathione lyase family enzyme
MDGISHITFIVRDLDRMAAFLCKGLGAREVYDSAGGNYSLSREKFFVLGGIWLAAMEGDPPAERSYHHIAFAVSESDLPMYQANLQALGAEFRTPRGRVDGEGQSLYFYDFDNHLFELHAGTLEQRLVRYGVKHPGELVEARGSRGFFVGWGTLSLINAGLAQSKGHSGFNRWLASLLIGPGATLLVVILGPVVVTSGDR